MKDWIDRYLYAVGQKLPGAQREDIKKELKSLILDDLDQRVERQRSTKGEDYKETEEDVLAILESFGSPAEVAAKYKLNNRYFIGPELYELYRMLLFIVLGAVSLGISIATIVSVLAGEGTFIEFLYKLPVRLISAGISAVGSITIVFAIIQHFTPEEKIKDINPNKDWSPKELEPVPVSHEIIKLSDTIAAICFTILALVIFNGFPHIIAMYVPRGDNMMVTPIFNLGILANYMKYLNIFWLGAVLLDIYKLKAGKWSAALRFAQVVIDVGATVIILLMAGNSGILNPALGNAARETGLEPLMKLGGIGPVAFKVFIAIIILTTVFEAGKHIYYSIKK